MKSNNIHILFLLILLTLFSQGQTRDFNLSGGSILQFKNAVYCFGMHDIGHTKSLKIYKCQTTLELKDSVAFGLSGDATKSYLQLSADTVHDFINIYVQEKNSKQADIYRLDKNLQLICHLKKIDVARINNHSVLGKDYQLITNGAYVIKQIQDSSGIMYYLNQYRLKSSQENFDYVLRWQYPFEKKYIQYINILHADTNQINLFVKIYKGPKIGHYYLTLDAKKGQLLKATKINEGQETHLMPGKYYYSSAEKDTWIFGQKLSGLTYFNDSKLLAASQESMASIYAVHLDSLGELLEKSTFNIPIKDYAKQTQKINQSYFLKITSLKKTITGAFSLNFDVYKNEMPMNNCFYYVHSQVIHFTYDGEKYQAEKTAIEPNAEIERFYRTKDKLNMNGKICIDSFITLPQFYREIGKQTVKCAFTTDEQNNGRWLLSKSDPAKNMYTIAGLELKNKVYELKIIDTKGLDVSPTCLITDIQTFIIGIQEGEKKYRLNLYRW